MDEQLHPDKPAQLFMAYKIAKVFGIPIRVHLSLMLFLPIIAWQFTPIMGYGFPGWIWGLGMAVSLFVCVALHELGHSLAAREMGLRVREILLLPIGGIAQLDRMPSRPRQEFLLAVAGPAVSLLLAALFWWGARIVAEEFALVNTALAMHVLAYINCVLALFNLIPSFPMDGGRAFRALLTPRLGRLRATRWATNIGKLTAVLLGLLGVSPPINIILVAIAFFLYSSASAEYRMVKLAERRKSAAPGASPPGTRTEATDDIITVSPSPFQKENGVLEVHPVREIGQDEKSWWA